jgi:hypothetical protein
VDAGDVRALELKKPLAQPEVDAGGLDLQVRVRERLDHQVALL